jgi:hypothetical protein
MTDTLPWSASAGRSRPSTSAVRASPPAEAHPMHRGAASPRLLHSNSGGGGRSSIDRFAFDAAGSPLRVGHVDRAPASSLLANAVQRRVGVVASPVPAAAPRPAPAPAVAVSAAVVVSEAMRLVALCASDEASTCTTAWRTIATLCGDGGDIENREVLCRAMVMSAAASVLSRAACDAGVAVACIDAVARLCGGKKAGTGYEDGIAAAVAAGVVPAIVCCMRQLEDIDTVASSGCGALCRVSRSTAGRTAAVAAAGGIEAVVSAMRRHRDASAVQQWGCAALSNMMADSAEIRAAVCAAGSIEAIVSAMRRHADASAVQTQGCRALWSLSFLAASEPLMVDAGAPEVIAVARRVHNCKYSDRLLSWFNRPDSERKKCAVQ